MGTSSSRARIADQSAPWVGRVSVFSGRPDPEWEVPDEMASHLMELWRRMPPEPVVRSEPGGLGYRFASLSSRDGQRWLAFGGVVRRVSPEGSELRRDEGGEFERLLLASAPAGILPPLMR